MVADRGFALMPGRGGGCAAGQVASFSTGRCDDRGFLGPGRNPWNRCQAGGGWAGHRMAASVRTAAHLLIGTEEGSRLLTILLPARDRRSP